MGSLCDFLLKIVNSFVPSVISKLSILVNISEQSHKPS